MHLLPNITGPGVGKRVNRDAKHLSSIGQAGKHPSTIRFSNQSEKTGSGSTSNPGSSGAKIATSVSVPGTASATAHSSQPSFAPQMHLAYEVKKLM